MTRFPCLGLPVGLSFGRWSVSIAIGLLSPWSSRFRGSFCRIYWCNLWQRWGRILTHRLCQSWLWAKGTPWSLWEAISPPFTLRAARSGKCRLRGLSRSWSSKARDIHRSLCRSGLCRRLCSASPAAASGSCQFWTWSLRWRTPDCCFPSAAARRTYWRLSCKDESSYTPWSCRKRLQNSWWETE